MSVVFRPRLIGLLVLLCLLLATGPTQAAIGLIDPRSPVSAVLAKPELDRIKGLQEVAYPGFVSPLSPDESTVLATLGRQVVLLEPASGAMRSVDLSALGTVQRLTNLAWRGPNRLVYLGVDTARRAAVLVAIDRATGAATATPVSLPGAPVPGLPALSPDGSRVLVAVTAGNSPAAAPADAFASPFTLEARLGLGRSRGFDGEEATLRAAADSVTLLLVDVPSGQASALMTLPPGSGIQSLAWSDDGHRLALSRFTIPEDTLVSPLKSIVNLETQGALPPDRNPFLQSNLVDVFTVGGEARQALLRATDTGELFSLLAWNRDGSVLMARTDAPTRLTGRAHPIYLIPERATYRAFAADGKPLGTIAHADLEAPVGSLTVLPGDEAIVNTAVGSDGAVVLVNRASGAVQRLPLPAGLSTNLRIAAGARQIYFLHTSFTRLPELYRANLDGSALAALTFVNADRAALNQVRADEVSFTLANGQTRAGYLIQPAAAAFPPQSAPIVVWQEGGPMSIVLNAYGANVEGPFNLLPNFGIGVLFLPLDGRYGFGVDRFRHLYNGDNFGKVDIDAQVEIVGQMVERGWTAPGKVGISGCSYGGYFAAQSIARHPTVYAAANPQCSLLDLVNEWQFGDRSPLVSFIMGGPPTTRLAAYEAASPVFNLGQARPATLIFHGTRDFLPIDLVATLHDQLQGNGAAVNMLAFVNEGHGLAQPNSGLMAAQLQVQWFRQYLK
ncbi:MAG: S9 family peptidase [Chloroflexi bacterium]|nr:S9 family peptidase [Chloroflexota bacterium]